MGTIQRALGNSVHCRERRLWLPSSTPIRKWHYALVFKHIFPDRSMHFFVHFAAESSPAFSILFLTKLLHFRHLNLPLFSFFQSDLFSDDRDCLLTSTKK